MVQRPSKQTAAVLRILKEQVASDTTLDNCLGRGETRHLMEDEAVNLDSVHKWNLRWVVTANRHERRHH